MIEMRKESLGHEGLKNCQNKAGSAGMTTGLEALAGGW